LIFNQNNVHSCIDYSHALLHLLLDDKRELINARRRATYLKNKENADANKEQMKAPLLGGYRKKYDDAAGKHLYENLPAVNMSGTTILYYSAAVE
jgi:hypothetical protein